MAEIESIGDDANEAVGNALASLVKNLFGYRTFLGLFAKVCQILGGWIDSLLYRDAGERGLRGAMGSLLQGAAVGAMIFGLHLIFGNIGPITAVVILWAAAMRWADWLAALDRRKREQTDGYLYSYFIGWPRFVSPERPNCYRLQGWLVVVVGVLLFLIDRGGGLLLILAGVCALCRLWTIEQIRREDAMDALDAEWLAGYRSRAKVQAGGADVEAQDVATARRISTADFIHHYI